MSKQQYEWGARKGPGYGVRFGNEEEIRSFVRENPGHVLVRRKIVDGWEPVDEKPGDPGWEDWMQPSAVIQMLENGSPLQRRAAVLLNHYCDEINRISAERDVRLRAYRDLDILVGQLDPDSLTETSFRLRNLAHSLIGTPEGALVRGLRRVSDSGAHDVEPGEVSD